MKKAIATICFVGSALSLTACDTTSMGDVDTQPPYAMERTAKYEQATKYEPVATPTKVAPAEKVFQRAQTK